MVAFEFEDLFTDLLTFLLADRPRALSEFDCGAVDFEADRFQRRGQAGGPDLAGLLLHLLDQSDCRSGTLACFNARLS
ncbi:hypothetical protein GCM10027088_27120 [Nocardia goodfellowii]